MIALLENGGTVTLDESFEMEGDLEINKAVTLDLNGHTLTADNRTVTVTSEGTLTIMDSSEDGSGTITGTSYGIKNEGTVLMTSGALYGSYGIVNSGTATITGGTFSIDPTTYVDTDSYNVINTGGTWTVTAK